MKANKSGRFQEGEHPLMLDREQFTAEYAVLDENADIDRTLYTYGFNSTEDTDCIDTEIAVLARAFDLDNVQSLTINGEVYPLS